MTLGDLVMEICSTFSAAAGVFGFALARRLTGVVGSSEESSRTWTEDVRLVDAARGLDGVFLGVVVVFLTGDFLVFAGDFLAGDLTGESSLARAREELLVRAIVGSEIWLVGGIGVLW